MREARNIGYGVFDSQTSQKMLSSYCSIGSYFQAFSIQDWEFVSEEQGRVVRREGRAGEDGLLKCVIRYLSHSFRRSD